MVQLKRYYILCIAFFACILLSTYAVAQPQARGFGNVAPAAASTSAGRTVALVVGVSDYPYVAPLNYAAEDALLMYDFLQSNAGGNVPTTNIKLLINEDATLQGVIIQGMSWLENTMKPTRGDRVFIYLAGHGDAVDSNEAYFLCYNVNPAGDKNNYQVTGALDIGKLKNRIAKFSAAGAEVVLIMDACRSGDLPGVRTGITNPFESVLERKAGETLMLSAGANQLAIEDGRWGKGHGVFTWHLIEGLSGKADENADGTIDFFEIEQYTKSKVRKETQAMGRLQVPQFAASPSGGGVLGRTDNNFLNKLSTESLSAVSISESIAQARTASESSWFTDSTLYAGFNELKKLLRDRKYLGDGSAEPIYTRLAKQFSADQIEPVRLYYMSALASAGFEAINRQMQLEVDYEMTDNYYLKRYDCLLKVRELRRSEGEVLHLDDHILLMQAGIANKRHGQLPKSMIKDLIAMKDRFPSSAAYFFWMYQFRIDINKTRQFSGEEKISSYYSLLDSCAVYAPAWSLIPCIRIVLTSQKDFTTEMGDEISRRIQIDSLNYAHRFSQVIYYSKHKPYDLAKWQQSLINWNKVTASFLGFTFLCRLFNSQNDEDAATENDIGVWLNSEALRNHFKLKVEEKDFQKCLTLLLDEIKEPNQPDVKLRGFLKDGIMSKVLDIYEKNNHQSEALDLLAGFIAKYYNDIENWPNLIKISAFMKGNPKYDATRAIADSIISVELSDYQKQDGCYIFSDSTANSMGWWINETLGIKQLDSFRNEQIRLLSEFKYPGFEQEFMSFKFLIGFESNEANDKENLNRLLSFQHPSFPMNLWIYEKYLEVAKSHQWTSKIADLYLTSSFQKDRKEYLGYKNGIWDAAWVRKSFALVESGYHCFQADTLALNNMLKRLLEEGDTTTFVSVLNDLEMGWKECMLGVLIGQEKIQLGFVELVDLGLLERAERVYLASSRSDDEFYFQQYDDKTIRRLLAGIKLFSVKGDYGRAAEIMEELIDLGASLPMSNELDEPIYSYLGPYDAFIQSKEYKAMMARVYTAPEK